MMYEKIIEESCSDHLTKVCRCGRLTVESERRNYKKKKMLDCSDLSLICQAQGS